MKDKQSCIDDAVEIAQERIAKGTLSRRGFNQILMVAAAMAGMGPLRGAFAESGSLVVANWGGDAVTAFEKSYQDFTATSGLKLQIDGSGPTEGAIKTQVNSGAVRWDVCDGEMYSSYRLGKEGVLTPIDYSVVDKSLIGYGDIHEFGLANYTYSYVLSLIHI